ncbi:MAG: Tyrosine recombinase XerC [Microgenomates bacterium OLB23]|nr:MAG: Tyrosine recombinase XerC [Microgenomates bacterium OLB23]
MITSDLRTLVQSFIEHLTAQGKSKHTVVAYKKDLEQFIAYIASVEKTDIKEVKKDDIDGFISKLLGEGYTKKSASRKLNSIRTFFRYLKQEQIIAQNPSLEVTHPKYNQAAPRILSKLEYRALRDFSKSDKRTYAMIELLLQTGVRIGELAEIKLSDITKEGLAVSDRVIPMNKAVEKAVESYVKSRHNSETDFLFVTKTGRQLLVRNIRSIITRCFREVGIENAKVQDLRNTFIAYQLMNGASISYISKIVGHRRLSSTEKYLELVKQETERKEKLGEL